MSVGLILIIILVIFLLGGFSGRFGGYGYGYGYGGVGVIGIVDHVTIDEGPRGSFLESQSENEPRGLQAPKRPKGSNPRRS
jgi:hypothetical protein